MINFTPRPWLFLRTVLGGLIAVTLIAYFWQRYHDGYWWSACYMWSLLIPAVFIIAVVWLAFVPVKFQSSDHSLIIKFPFRPTHDIGWDELRFWGNSGEGTFALQFTEGRRFSIALFAFAKSERRQLIDFLSNRFPERKVRSWFGVRGTR
jgi:hypothetical protein